MPTIDLLCGDVMTTEPGGLYHALLCDPPYHLTQPNIRNAYNPTPGLSSWDAVDEARRQARKGKNSAGFMGKAWDGGDVAFRPETWARLAEHLLPGAFGMAFASARGWHRMACAIEDAGFVIHPTIFCWAFGSGFPKSTRIDTQVDRAAGAERDDKIVGGHIGVSEHGGDGRSANELRTSVAHIIGKGHLTNGTPATPLAAAWAGHRYGLQALKPAVEPIIVFQKPYEGRPVECITRTGAGALNVDGGRIGTAQDDDFGRSPFKVDGTRSELRGGQSGLTGLHTKPTDTPPGRWPANFILADDDAADALDRQSGVSKSNSRSDHEQARYGEVYGWAKCDTKYKRSGGHDDSGGASRFFYRVSAALDDADPVAYKAKASRRERDAGLEGMAAQYRGTMGHFKENPGRTVEKGGGVPVHNPHPTVKPLDLCRYLATLLLPPAEYAPRRILVPFAGTGSEMIGASLAGWDEVVGIERDSEYVEIGRARIAHWCSQPTLMQAAT